MTSPPEARSSGLFQVALDSGIPTTVGVEFPVDDDTFVLFQQRYGAWATARDSALAQYLSSTRTPLRVAIPLRDHAYELASRVAWYLDEIVISDPISLCLSFPERDPEAQKLKVIAAVQHLSTFRPLIEAGYLLFRGSPGGIASPPPPSDTAIQLIQNDDVLQALKNATRCGFEFRTGPEGIVWGVFQLMLEGGGVVGFDLGKDGLRLKGPFTLTTPNIRAGEMLPPISPEDLGKILRGDPWERMFSIFGQEVDRVLTVASRAQSIGAAVLFDRELDAVIMDRAAVRIDTAQQRASLGVLNLVLPYVEGIPPSDLADLRAQIPQAFVDFRGRLVEVVLDAMKDGTDHIEDLRFKVERTVVPQIRNLEAEISAALKRAKILGLAYPLASGLGTLAGWTFGAPAGVLAAAVGTSVGASAIAALTASADVAAAKERAAGHPFYFLWKARQRNLGQR